MNYLQLGRIREVLVVLGEKFAGFDDAFGNFYGSDLTHFRREERGDTNPRTEADYEHTRWLRMEQKREISLHARHIDFFRAIASFLAQTARTKRAVARSTILINFHDIAAVCPVEDNFFPLAGCVLAVGNVSACGRYGCQRECQCCAARKGLGAWGEASARMPVGHRQE